MFFMDSPRLMWRVTEWFMHIVTGLTFLQIKMLFGYVGFQQRLAVSTRPVRTAGAYRVLANFSMMDYETQVVEVPNPRHAVTQGVVAQATTRRKTKQIVQTLVAKRLLILALKAELFARILMGRTAYAVNPTCRLLFSEEAQTSVADAYSFENRHTALYALLARALWSLVAFCQSMVLQLTQWVQPWVNGAVAYVLGIGPEGYAALEWMFVICAVVAATNAVCWTYNHFKERHVLRAVVKSEKPKYVARRVTEHGIIHEIVVDGVVHVLADCEKTIYSEDEMALPGSTLYPSAPRNVGAILVAGETGELSVLGVFFRVGEHLVTAGHVANAVGTGVARVFLAGLKNSKKELHTVDVEGVIEFPKDQFDLDCNAIKSDYDVFAMKLSQKTWAKLRIGVSSTRKDSCYSQTISAVGFVGNLFMTSSGKTLAGSGVEELWHTATTHVGFSGSPLFSGSSVVGMHLSGQGDKNVALRVEILLMLLAERPESNNPDRDDSRPDFKFKGRSHKVKELLFGDFYGFYDSHGRVDVGWTREEVEELMKGYNSGNPRFDNVGTLVDPDLTPLTDKSYRQFLHYMENAPLPAIHVTPEAMVAPANAPSVEAPQEQIPDEPLGLKFGVVRLPGKQRVHCNHTPAEVPAVVDYLDRKAAALQTLGFDAKKYQYPDITAHTERISVVRHLELYHERVQSITKPPNPQEIAHTVRIVTEMMGANVYEPDADWRSAAAVVRVIDSNAVKPAKSPGHPYQSAGHATIEQVLKAYTKEGFAELVLREWDSTDIELKAFIKAEPTKEAKIEKGMARCVTGMPLHKTVKNNCVFGPFANTLVKDWKKSPAKYAFNPQRAGDIAHLAEVFEGRQVTESDKANWDYNFFPYLFEISCKVTQSLAVRPAGMSEEQFAAYLADVQSCYDEVTKHAVYRCTDGSVWKSQHDGVQKSGWFMTIAANTIGQLALHVLAALRTGCTAEQLLSPDFAIIAGGDDVLQTFPKSFKTEKYREELGSLGFVVSDFKTHKQFDGCEFFSNELRKEDGAWTYHPTRFTKHVAHLRVTKREDLASALSSHMLNHVWNRKKFAFFEEMFQEFRKDDPLGFPLVFLKSRTRLQYQVLGLESA